MNRKMKLLAVTSIVLLALGLATQVDAKTNSKSRHGPTNSAGTFVFNPNSHTWTAYDPQGHAVKSGPASGGKGYCPDIHRRCKTPIGHFRVYSKGPASCKSGRYPVGEGGAPMPYCMFFHGNYAIHGSYQVPRYNASHGCIRVHPAAAKWLSHNFMKIGTRVIVVPY